MKITREFASASMNTFSISPIYNLINRHLAQGKWIDPFVNESIFKARMWQTNDLNPVIAATYHENAIEFLKRFSPNSIDGILFDPPYSVRQIAECYNSIGLKHEENTTRSDFYSELKDQIAIILRPKGKLICCGWNTNGGGIGRRFQMIEILIVHHGGIHNDTLVTVEMKAQAQLI